MIIAGNERVIRARLSDAQVLLRHRPGAAARARPAQARGERSSTPSSARSSSASSGWSSWPPRSRRWSAPMSSDAKRAAHAGQGRPRHRHGRRVPRAAGPDGPLLRRWRRARPPAIANAIDDHYKPLGPTDRVPTEPVAIAVALADKLDLLTGFWAIDEKPTGSRDPFALRRAALGVIRIVVENELTLPAQGRAGPPRLLPRPPESHAARRRRPPRPRRRGHLRPDSDDILQITRRVDALSALLGSEDGTEPARRLQRGGQYPRRRGKEGRPRLRRPVDPELLTLDAEIALADAISRSRRRRGRPRSPPTTTRAPSPRWPRCAPRSTPSSRRCWSTTPIRPSAPTGSTCWPSCATPCTWWRISRRSRAR